MEKPKTITVTLDRAIRLNTKDEGTTIVSPAITPKEDDPMVVCPKGAIITTDLFTAKGLISANKAHETTQEEQKKAAKK